MCNLIVIYARDPSCHLQAEPRPSFGALGISCLADCVCAFLTWFCSDSSCSSRPFWGAFIRRLCQLMPVKSATRIAHVSLQCISVRHAAACHLPSACLPCYCLRPISTWLSGVERLAAGRTIAAAGSNMASCKICILLSLDQMRWCINKRS
jgi:hypothetical protein